MEHTHVRTQGGPTPPRGEKPCVSSGTYCQGEAWRQTLQELLMNERSTNTRAEIAALFWPASTISPDDDAAKEGRRRSIHTIVA